jgi:tRNA A37 threonylcarbamoyladenosine modification protein TsaB
MRVLAIDTALEACSAAVLDTDSGIAASETLAMTRGHAEAVTPLIARVMSAAYRPRAASRWRRESRQSASPRLRASRRR